MKKIVNLLSFCDIMLSLNIIIISLILGVQAEETTADTTYVNAVMYFSIQNTTINIPVSLHMDDLARKFTTMVDSGSFHSLSEVRQNFNELTKLPVINENSGSNVNVKKTEFIYGAPPTTRRPYTTARPTSSSTSVQILSTTTFRPFIRSNYSQKGHESQKQITDCRLCTTCVQNHLKDSEETNEVETFRAKRCALPFDLLNKTIECKEAKYLILEETHSRNRRDVQEITERSEDLRTSHYSGTCEDNSDIQIAKYIGKNCNRISELQIAKFGLCYKELKCPEGKVIQENFCSPKDKVEFFEEICSDNEYHIAMSTSHYSEDVAFDDTSICAIEGFNIKPCLEGAIKEFRKLSIIKLNDVYQVVTKPHFIQFDPDLSSIANYHCKACKRENCLKCDGDSVYKRMISTDKSGPCYCEYVGKTIGKLTLFMEGIKIPIEEIRSDVYQIRIQSQEPSYKKPEPTHCKDCAASCQDLTVELSLVDDKVKSLKFCTRISCFMSEYKSHVKLPASMLLIESTVDIFLFDSIGNLLYTKSVQCQIKDQCDLIDCKLCMRNLLNVDCYDNLDKIYLLLAVVLLTLFLTILAKIMVIIIRVFVIFKWIWLTISHGYKLSKKIFYCLRGYRIENVKRVRTKKVEFDDETIELITEEVKETPVRKSPSQRRDDYLRSIKLENYVVIIALLVLGLGFAQSCTVLSTNTLQETSCIHKEDEKMMCRTDEKVSLLLPGFGGDSCLLLKSAAGTIVGSLKMKIMDIKARCIQNHLYYTYKPILKKMTSCHCWPSSLCADANCFSYNGTQSYPGLLLKPTNLPNRSICRKIDSDWFGSCVISTTSCCYSQLTMNIDESNVYRLQKCSSFYWEVDVEVKMFSDNKNIHQNLSIQAGTKLSNKLGEFILTSVSEPMIGDKTKCIMTNLRDKSDSLVDCSDKDEFIKGRIGEVRCSSLPKIKPGSCSLASDLVRDEIQGFNLVMEAELIDLEKIHKSNSIPVNKLAYEFNKDSKGYYFNNPRYSMFRVQVGLKDFQVSSKILEVDCTFSFVELKGCHSCPMGAQVTLKTSCSEYPNLAFLKCPYGPSTPFVISVSGKLNVRFASNISKIDETCEITVNKYSHNIKVRGSLLTDMEDLDINIKDDVSSTKVTFGYVNDKFFTNILAFFSGIFGHWRYWVVIFIVLGVVIGLSILKYFMAGSTITRVKQV
ncbi:putative glycoprotein [Hubei diptera virus 3]|uniref:Putative glycoprotein n=1 Tax=Hubei diptera virus 3 TaxID=1922884 RepID=A0A1L3KPH2_9VIRU|nr:putative glycoprotein [Hubei diptera virus 3]APG79286.1 putative glycoprotein [Hubei diptera virus 3]